MPGLRKTIENIYYAVPDENSATQNQEAVETNEEEKDLSRETHTRVETTLKKPRQPKKPKPKSAANIIRDFTKKLQQSKQKRIILHVANKTARTQDFGTSEFNKIYKMGTGSIQNIFNHLFKELGRLGLKKIQTTERTNHGLSNHYLIIKPINEPSEEPKETDESKIKNGRSQHQKVIKNLDFIPSELHETLLFLMLSSKYDKWVGYGEISRETGQNQKTTSAQIQNLKKILPKIELELLEEKNKKGKKYFHLTIPGKSEEKQRDFYKKEWEREKNRRTDKTHRPSKIRMISTSEVIKRNWPKRKPKDEWYETDLQPKPKPRWCDITSSKGVRSS